MLLRSWEEIIDLSQFIREVLKRILSDSKWFWENSKKLKKVKVFQIFVFAKIVKNGIKGDKIIRKIFEQVKKLTLFLTTQFFSFSQMQLIRCSIAIYLMCLCIVSAKPTAKPDAKPGPQIYFPYNSYYSNPYYTSPYSYNPYYNYNYYWNNLNSLDGTGGYNGQIYRLVYPYTNYRQWITI